MKAFKISRLVFWCTMLAFLNLTNLQGQTKKQEPVLGYGHASYTALTDNEFMKDWLILGPVKLDGDAIKTDDSGQKRFFEKDVFTTVAIRAGKPLGNLKINNVEYAWEPMKSEEGFVDLSKLLGKVEYSIAYALAEIRMDVPAKVIVGIGSDDGIKLYLNGRLVHQNWIGRPTTPDEDIAILNLKKGSNQILLKIQNMEQDWSFAIRKMGKESLKKALIESSGRGNLDNVKILTDDGVDLNAPDDSGLTAYQSAMIRGREKIMDYLKDKGVRTDIPMPSFKQLVDCIFKNVYSGITSGVSVLVSKNGEIIYEKGFGYADIGNKVPVTPDTKFRIGSITKQFTAAAILKLQEEKKLNIQDVVSKYIPGFPKGNEITLRHLLTHTSGLHSYTDRPSFFKFVTLPISLSALVDTIQAQPYDFAPGNKWNYCNSGFVLLGYIVEKISGKSLAIYLNDTFFEPLGMNNTGIYETNKLIDNEAYGYSFNGNKIIKAINWDMSWAAGAGALYSTVRDLNIWNEALFNGKVLTEESLKAAFTSSLLNNKQKTNYGYGWFIQNIRGSEFISHGGGLNGFLSYLGRQPENKFTVIVLCNSTPPPSGLSPTNSASLISEYILWPEMIKQPTFASDIPVDEKLINAYVGRYDYGQGAVLTVTLEGKQLYAQMTGQGKYPIFPSSKDEFNWKIVDASVKFVVDEKGKVIYLLHHQNGQQIEAKKLKEEIPVAVDFSVFDKYTGKYDMGNNYVMAVLKVDKKLFLQGSQLTRFQLFPASETEFFAREINIRLKFKAHGEQKADSVIVVISGEEKVAKRVGD